MPRKLDFTVETPTRDRLDLWLVDHLQDFSRSRIQTLITDGHITVNQGPCDRKTKLHPGDQIRILLPKTEPLELQPENIPLDILYEDDHLIILNKPPGMVVHPSAGHRTGTLVHALLHHCQGQLAGIGGIERPGIVHRLDKDTTGTLVIAKTDIALSHLQNQLREKTAKREYLGICYGSPREASGRIERPLGRDPKDRKKQAIVQIDKGGRRAVTHWKVQERMGNYSLLHFQLETGRTHQIRIHCLSINHPIVGDPIYSAGRSLGVKLEGQALHAWRLTLEHPVTGEEIVAMAPPPESFVTLMQVLRRRAAR
ncbi:MAG: RluA family pseudouridine synthase [Synechococcales cyanobacterium RM1_1_8]|nr:RluA family pseudouridine synthase [Synechococcales cyanobacterium RM1_1_8]